MERVGGFTARVFLMPYSVREPSYMSSESFIPAGARNQTDVYAVHGADPEVLAYAMAKYSRSSLSMRESLAEISAQRAEQFATAVQIYNQLIQPAEGDSAQSREAVVKMAKPAMATFFAPTRSPRAPAVRIKAANAIV